MNTQVKIAPSLLSANFAKLEHDVRACELGGADMLHLDIMDGCFVPNITFGPLIVAAVRDVTTLPLDCHLMIVHPDRYIEQFAQAGAQWISVHVEVCKHLHRTLSLIRSCEARAGIALNPLTPLEYVFEAAPHVDFVLMMCVNPGFGGQEFISSVLGRIERLRSWLERERMEIPIEVDGGVHRNNAAKLIKAGASVLVAGAAIFNGGTIAENIAALRRATER